MIPRELPPHFPYTGNSCRKESAEGFGPPHDLFKVPLLRLGIQDIDGPSKYLKFFSRRYMVHMIQCWIFVATFSCQCWPKPANFGDVARSRPPTPLLYLVRCTDNSLRTDKDRATGNRPVFLRGIWASLVPNFEIHAIYILGVPPSQ